MGSVRHRLSEFRQDCNVVLVGDVRVGKSALVNRFINNKFSEGYKPTPATAEKITTSTVVGNQHRLKYTIWDTTGSHAVTSTRATAYREADVFLLCYKISEPSSLFNALNHWCPEMRSVSPNVPIILVGCQSDLRSNRDNYKHNRAPISSQQALTFSQQINAVMYVETSARIAKTAISAFEAAGLAFMGKLTKNRQSPALLKKNSHRFSSTSPGSSLERSDVSSDDIVPPTSSEQGQFWDRLGSPKLPCRSISEAPRTPSLHSSRSASLSSKSIPSISSLGSKTPKAMRKASMKSITSSFGANNSNSVSSGGHHAEKTMTIKCQRLTADRTYEEIEVEVPVPIYETIQLYNDTGSCAARSKERRSLGSKLRNLFVRDS